MPDACNFHPTGCPQGVDHAKAVDLEIAYEELMREKEQLAKSKSRRGWRRWLWGL